MHIHDAQGHAPDELPEHLLGTVRLSRMDSGQGLKESELPLPAVADGGDAARGGA